MNICSRARNLVVSDPTFANLPKKEAPLAVPGGLCPLILAMHPHKGGGYGSGGGGGTSSKFTLTSSTTGVNPKFTTSWNRKNRSTTD